MRVPLVRYRSVVADSARWEGFIFRDDDIVISTPIKCGSTWMQMICALLIFRQRTFPTTLDRVSPWLDMLTRPLASVVADLDAQQHRRFVKSHTPLDGLPFSEHVTYICVGRDPRDVALSFDNHMANMKVDALLATLESAGALDRFADVAPEAPAVPRESEHERFWRWVYAPESPGLRATIHHLMTFWAMRERPNVVLMHYDDLKADLGGQMRCLTERLGVTIPEALWPELVQAATLEDMRRRADELVPNSTAGLWHDNGRFFNKGTSGQWKRLLNEEDLRRRYQARIKELADPELAAWIHRGPIVG